MAIEKLNFRPVRDVLPVQRADYPLADKTLAQPNSALVLIDGEWVSQNDSGQLVRASTIGSVGNEASKISYPVWAERGRTDVQALGGRKVPVLWLGAWEFETLVFDATATPGSGAAITFVGQPVKVATITIGTRNYTGLVGHGGSGDASIRVGYVTKLASANSGWLRIRGGVLY